jgi:acetoacetyl-CoA synthetase
MVAMESGSGPDAVTASIRGDVLWTPTAEWLRQTRLADYMAWLERERGLRLSGYRELWQWSVTDLSAFWASIWDYFDVLSSSPATAVLADDRMPGAVWFPGARLNWAENLLRERPGEGTAIIGLDELGTSSELSWAELRAQVGTVAAQLRAWGIQPGDRVAAYLPNAPETVVALMATAAVGAVWACCAPDFSVSAAADRLGPLTARVLFTVDGYRFGGREISREAEATELAGRLGTVEHVVTVRRSGGPAGETAAGPARETSFADLIAAAGEDPAGPAGFEQVPFDHPLWILFSSGTTGAPKGIVHSHGGILLESLKANALQYDIRPRDRVFIAASTAWVVWNMLVDSMCTGATIVTYDGSPLYPSPGRALEIAADLRAARFGTGAAYLAACHRADLHPADTHDFSALRTIMSTGSPLPEAAWRWVYERIKSDVMLGSDSGGTDVATGFIGSNPMLPVRVGQSQSASLGVLAQAWDEAGEPVIGEVGELVIAAPMPSMPIYFYNDPDGSKYHDAYFSVFPAAWRHGDWVTEAPDGSFGVHGRSDATINRGGVRMGSADIYAALADCAEVTDSLVVGVELPDAGYYLPMFVQLRAGEQLDDELRAAIRARIRAGASPRHVPDEIIAVPGIPLTRTGKKLEIAVKRLMQGAVEPSALPLGSMQDPGVMQWYIDFAASFRSGT